ncbi:MAG: tetratricopeptide repeat protein, partial [Anaerolineales bacterium]|nr:tetratricopeptide repeat protein [Anaerolineales bacterium]
DFDTAQTYYQESLSIREAMRDARGQAICLNYLGDTVRAMGSSEAAIAHYQASLKIAKEIGDLASLAISLTRLGFVYRAAQNEEQAWHCFRDALQQAPAMPQRLNALVGMAALIHAADPELAANIVAKIRRHPVATAETKEIAAELQAALPQSEGDSSLEQLIDVILSKRPEVMSA